MIKRLQDSKITRFPPEADHPECFRDEKKSSKKLSEGERLK